MRSFDKNVADELDAAGQAIYGPDYEYGRDPKKDTELLNRLEEAKRRPPPGASGVNAGAIGKDVSDYLIGGGETGTAVTDSLPAGNFEIPSFDAGITDVSQVALGETPAPLTDLTSFGGFNQFGLSNAAAGIHGAYGAINDFGSGQGPIKGGIQGAEIAYSLYPFLGPYAAAAIPIGALAGMATTGKTNQAHIDRDSIRKNFAGAGLGPEDTIEFTDGTKFDFDQEGDGGTYNTPDPNNDLVKQIIGQTNPLGEMLTEGGTDKHRSDATGMLTSAVLNGLDINDPNSLEAARKRVQDIYQKLGITPDQAVSKINELADKGMLSQDEKTAYAAPGGGIGQAFSGTNLQELLSAANTSSGPRTVAPPPPIDVAAVQENLQNVTKPPGSVIPLLEENDDTMEVSNRGRSARARTSRIN